MVQFIRPILLILFLVSCGDMVEETPLSLKTKGVSATLNQSTTSGVTLKLDKGFLKKPYKFDIASKNSFSPEGRYYLYEGELPRGLELDEDSGVISGTPLQSGDFDFSIAYQEDETSELNIIPCTVNLNDNMVMVKEVRSFIDISKTSDKTRVNSGDVINLPPYTGGGSTVPFFKFYGENVSNLTVCEQGYIKIGSSSCTVSDFSMNTKIIAPFYDRELVSGTWSRIYYQIRGEAPRRMLIVQWEKMRRSGALNDEDASQTFEVAIHEGSNDIQFLYGLSYSKIDTSQKHLGKDAKIGVSNNNHADIVTEFDTNIFPGTVILLEPTNSTTGHYTSTVDGNLVTDFTLISRYVEEAESCSTNNDCTSGNCVGNKCMAHNISNNILYDNGYQVDLPFEFYFYGERFEKVNIHENGYLYFSTPTSNINLSVPKDGAPLRASQLPFDYTIAAMWSDIDLKQVRGGNVVYNVLGESPNRKFVALYEDVRIMSNGTEFNLCSFEIILHETSNIIEVLYGPNNGSEYCTGKASTVGLKRDSAHGVEFGRNFRALRQGKSILFIPNNNIAATYTWIGLGNERDAVGNSGGNTLTANGFTYMPGGWTDITDQNTIFTGYTQSRVSNNWITTTSAQVFNLGDDTRIGFTSPVPFVFNGTQYQQIYVQSNGSLTLANEYMTWSEPSSMDYTYQYNRYPDQAIHVYWNDLNPNTGGNIRAGLFTDGTNNMAVFEWSNVPTYYADGNNRFQVQLYDDGRIYMCYQAINDQSHLTGIRINETQYYNYSGSIPDLVSSGDCILYTPNYVGSNGIRSTVAGTNNGHENVNIGFPFEFIGATYNQVRISENGSIILGNSSENLGGLNYSLSDPRTPDNLLAPFWDSLDNRDRDVTGGVFYTTTGTAPNRKFIVSYNDTAHTTRDLSHIDAQVVLEETTNDIYFCYKNLLGPYGNGNSSTVGIKGTNGFFDQLSYNIGDTIQPNSCYKWNPPTATLSARNIYRGKINDTFIELPLDHSGLVGEEIKQTYDNNGDERPYAIFDLSGVDYTFNLKGKSYDKLFVTGNGAVSFGNENTAFIVTGPLWQDVWFSNEILNEAHESLSSPYDDVESNFMWIANAGAGTLTKVNTFTGSTFETSYVGSSPSRTSVGFDGSVWVGNRGSYNVTKVDRDGNIVCTVNLQSGCAPRAVALDRDENAWVGCMRWNSSAPEGWVYKLRHNRDTDTCEIVDIRAPGDPYAGSTDRKKWAFKGHQGNGTYGFALDRNGILWSSPGTWGSSNSYFLRIDTNKQPGDVGFYKKFRGYSSNSNPVGNTWVSDANNTGHAGTPFYYYGIAVDLDGNLWLGNWGFTNSNRALTKATYDEVNDRLVFEVFGSYNNQYVSNARGVAIDADGSIWVAYSGNHKLGKFSPNGDALGLFNAQGINPTGVGVDGDGDVWVNNMKAHSGTTIGSSCEFDSNGNFKRCLNVGRSPYCYSDNTGFNLRNIVSGIKPAKYYAGIVVEEPDSQDRCARKLVVQWRNVRLKRAGTESTPYLGYTEANVEMIFDNGFYYENCSSNNRTLTSVPKPPTITFTYGSMAGNNFDLKTGGHGQVTLRSLYGSYNHSFGDDDPGTINSGSTFVIIGK